MYSKVHFKYLTHSVKIFSNLSLATSLIDDDEDDHEVAKVNKPKPETENKVQANGENNTATTNNNNNNNNEEEEIYEWEYYYEDAELKKDDKHDIATTTTAATATTKAAAMAQPVKPVTTTAAVAQPVTTTAHIVQGWECPGCTFMNEPTRPGCAVCATDRPETDGATANEPEVAKEGDQQAPVVKVRTIQNNSGSFNFSCTCNNK